MERQKKMQTAIAATPASVFHQFSVNPFCLSWIQHESCHEWQVGGHCVVLVAVRMTGSLVEWHWSSNSLLPLSLTPIKIRYSVW